MSKDVSRRKFVQDAGLTTMALGLSPKFIKAQQDSIKKLNVALEAPIKEKVDASIEWITKAYDVIKDKEKLERSEKNVAARSVDFLATLYGYKRDKARGKDLKAADEFEAKYNMFDKLHDKYN